MKKLMAFLGTKMIEKSIGKQTKTRSFKSLTCEEVREYFDSSNYEVLATLDERSEALLWLEEVGIPNHNKLIDEIGR